MTTPAFDHTNLVGSLYVNGRKSGTAFLIGPNDAITNVHVALNTLGQPKTNIEIRFENGLVATAHVSDSPWDWDDYSGLYDGVLDTFHRSIYQWDIAHLTLDSAVGLTNGYFDYAMGEEYHDDKVYTAGYPGSPFNGVDQAFGSGIWTHYNTFHNYVSYQNNVTAPGSSGSPIWVERDGGASGVVIGVHNAGTRRDADSTVHDYITGYGGVLNDTTFAAFGTWITGNGDAPDLIISDADFGPSVWATNNSNAISWQVENIGNGDTGIPRIGLYLSTDSTVTVQDTFLGSVAPDSRVLAGDVVSGEVTTASFDLTQVDPGTYYVGFLIDDTDSFVESDDTNNASAVQQITIIEDDIGASPDAARQLLVLDSVVGDIQYATDRDWFAVNLAASFNYAISMSGAPSSNGTLEDAQMWIRDNTGAIVAYNDNGGTSTDARILFSPDHDATYYIDAAGVGSDTGTYVVHVDIAGGVDDNGQTVGDHGAITPGTAVQGNIETAGDRDWFAVTLEAGQDYRVEMRGIATAHGTLVDPYLIVRDATGVQLAHDNDVGIGENARLVFTPDSDGLYFLEASAFENAGNGSYQLSIDPRPTAPAGMNFRVSDETGGNRHDTQSSPLPDGGWVVVWEALAIPSFHDVVFGQRYDANGAELGDPFRALDTADNRLTSVGVTALADGSWLVYWRVEDFDAFEGKTFGRMYTADGNVGDPFVMNTGSPASGRADVAALSDGGWVLTWRSWDDESGIFGKRFTGDASDPDGTYGAGDAFLVSSSGSGSPQVTALPDDGWIIAWDGSGSESGNLYGRQYGPDGTALGDAPYRINPDTGDDHENARSALLADGTVVTVWDKIADDGNTQIVGQYFQPDGTQDPSQAFEITTDILNNHAIADVVALAEGGFVVVWTTYEAGTDEDLLEVHALRYTADGQPAPEGVLRVNATFTDYGDPPTVAALEDGGFVVTWFSDRDDIREEGNFAQRYDRDGNPVSSELSNRPPWFASHNTFHMFEQSEIEVGTIEATDPNGGRVTYSITGGDDGHLFTITADTGLLEFRDLPDFESPRDDGADNLYEVQVTVTQPGGVSASDTVFVHITNVDEVPVGGTDYLDAVFGMDLDISFDTLLANDTHPEDAELTIEAVLSTDTLGFVGILDDETIRYTPGDSFAHLGEGETATDAFSYWLGDGDGTPVLVDVVVTVSAAGPTLTGTSGPDHLTGTSGADRIAGLEDADTLVGGDGADTLIGGPGDDVYHIVDGDDRVVELQHEGRDHVMSAVSFDFREHGDYLENLTLTGDLAIDGHGNTGANKIMGNDAANLLAGHGGYDTIQGHGGADDLQGGNGDDRLEGGDGDDTLTGFGGLDILDGGAGNDLLDGKNGNDHVYGRTGDDLLIGWGGRDRLRSNDGDDTLIGGAKNDFLQGGAGADTFVFNTDTGNWGKDYIRDFELGVDRVQIGGFTEDDVTLKAAKTGVAVIAVVQGGGKIVFNGFEVDQLDTFADWDFV